MSCIQVSACNSTALNVLNIPHLRYSPTGIQLHNDSTNYSTRLHRVLLRLTTSASRYQQGAPVCLFGGKGKSGNDNEASPWKSLEKAMGSLKKEQQSLEDVLRQQIEKQEFYDDGDSGGNRGGGGGGGGGSDSYGESEDEGLSGILDEVLQVVLGTIGIIFLYIYIIECEEITVFAKDLLKFLFTRQKSIRLRRIMYQWGKFFQRLTAKKYPANPYTLEHAIINTPTWWDSPTKYRRLIRSYLASRSYDDY